MRHNLLLNVASMSMLIAILSLSSFYFYNQHVADASARSSSLGLQICCSWGNEVADGILTYRIDDDANQQVVQAVHQAVNEWNSKIPNIKLQEATGSNADIDISTNSKAPKVSHAISIGGPML